MYLPPMFAETDPAEIHRILRAHPLGTLVTHGPNGLDASHLPFLLDAQRGPQGTLLAHVARANALWREVRDGDPVLVVFRGAQGYISPNWYPSKQETHRHVPTWNYEAVHVHGHLRIHDDPTFVRGVVAPEQHIALRLQAGHVDPVARTRGIKHSGAQLQRVIETAITNIVHQRTPATCLLDR